MKKKKKKIWKKNKEIIDIKDIAFAMKFIVKK